MRFWTILFCFAALIAAPGCSDDPIDYSPGNCPAGASYDADLGRCVLDDPPVNQESPDAGGLEDTGQPGTPDTGSQDPDTGSQNPDTGSQDPDTGSQDPDTGSQDPDTGPQDPCDGISCGANASCHDGVCTCNQGYEGDPNSECLIPPPCDGDCPFGATCLDDQCICDPGFTAVADGCQLDSVSDPATRSQAEVCQGWTQNPIDYNIEKWAVEPQDQCDPGRLSEAYHMEAIREITRFRWLVGLPAVTTVESMRDIVQACATTLAAEDDGLTHAIPPEYACYTQQAASGAGSSNLAFGVGHAAGTVALYIQDWNVPSLGHRRWIFNPRKATTAFGSRGSYSCQYSFDTSGSFSTEFTAYPAPGYFPRDALMGKWSLSSDAMNFHDETEILMESIPDGEEIGVHSFNNHAWSSSRPDMISWRPTVALSAGDSVKVTIVDAYGEGDDFDYEVHFVSCD